MTIVCSPGVGTFGTWAEQLIAESTGKQGTGVVPVAGEALGALGESDVLPRLRVDLLDRPAKGEVWQAVVTPRWGQPSTFEVTLADGLLVLSKGNATLTSTSSVGTVSDVWQTLTFEVWGKRLNGVVTAEGQQTVVRGDGAWSGLLGGRGQIVRDATPPEGRAGLPGGMGPDEKLMPWDPLQVALAEPLASTVPVESELESADGSEVSELVVSVDASGLDAESTLSVAGAASSAGALPSGASGGRGRGGRACRPA